MVFHLLSKGKTEIKMEDLIQFLDQQGFYAKTEDLEAILRRCDHDADRSISFEEFAEILGRDYDQLIAEREKLVELAAKSRKEEYDRIKREQE
jgi:Ca2+-binding EF-hand superfamily protein